MDAKGSSRNANAATAGTGAGAANVESALIAWGELKFREDALGRDAEEREWQEEGLFYQRRQWLEWKEGERRYTQLKPDKRKPRPMPVSNYFAKTVNANANQLGAQVVKVTATPRTDDAQTRRAADYAEMAKDALDIETNLIFLNPLLAKHTALWGIGVLKDTIDTSADPQALDEQETEDTNVVGCLDCGGVNELEPGQMDSGDFGQQTIPCPDCGSDQTANWTRQRPIAVSQYVSGKGYVRTEVRPIFEVYLPRDVQNPNLTYRVVHRYRRTLSELRRKYDDKAEKITSDDPATNTSETRYDVLRTLSSYTFAERVNAETAVITEIWSEWDKLPKRLQEAIADEFAGNEDGDEEAQETAELSQRPQLRPGNPAPAQPGDEDELARIKQHGIFFIYSQGTMLEWGSNPNVDPDSDENYFPFTFFVWDADPASVYPKGIGADLVPLQKRLNRLDSLIELGMLSNAAGKWIWPTTQSNMKPPNGDPSDVIMYDPIGDGKAAPEFVQPQPFTGQVWQYRAAILSDFQQLGLTLGVQTGDAGGQSSFRGIAYLGAKASEQLNTQRYLWESAHCLHYKKLLLLAKLVWDEERQVKVSGPNGRYLFESFTGEDLLGSYEVNYVPNSSIPKTQDEKLEMLQTLVEGGLVDLTDPGNRQYVYELINLEGVNLVNELQMRKAERDLEAVKRGEMPHESPFQDWNIELKAVANYTLTEEFERLDPQLQTYVLAFGEYCNQKVQFAAQQQMMTQLAMQQPPSLGKRKPSGSADPNNQTLAKVPGVTSGPGATQDAALSQGDQFAHQMGA
jgi:hypothetical protein